MSAVETLDPAAFPGLKALTVALRQCRQTLKLPRRCRVVLWGLPEGANRKEASVKPLLAPLSGAGFRVERVVSPCNALAALARVKTLRGEGATCWLAINRGGVAIVVVQPGKQLYAHSFVWDSNVGSSGSQARMLQRYSLVSYLSPEVKRAMAEARRQGTSVDAVVTCGNLPDLRSLTMPLIEELDVEVETLDSLDGLVVAPAVAERVAEAASSIRLACAGAIARGTRPWNESKRRTAHRTDALRRVAAVLAIVALGALGYAWYDRWRTAGSATSAAAPVSRTPAPPSTAAAPPTSAKPAGVEKPTTPETTPPIPGAKPPVAATTPPVVATRPPAAASNPPAVSVPPAASKPNLPAVSVPPAAPKSNLPAVSTRPVTPRPNASVASVPAAAGPSKPAPPKPTAAEPRSSSPDPRAPSSDPRAPSPQPRSAVPAPQPSAGGGQIDRPVSLPAPGIPAAPAAGVDTMPARTDKPPASPAVSGPPPAGFVGAMPSVLKDPVPRVTAILVSHERRFATVNDGQIVGIGDVIGKRIVVAIDDQAVVLREPSGVQIRVGLGGRILGIERGR